MKWESPATPDPPGGPEDAADEQRIESLLRRMPLRQPTTKLDARVSRALAAPPQILHFAAFKAAAAAAIVVGAALLMLQRHAITPGPEVSRSDSGVHRHSTALVMESRLRVERDAQRLTGGAIIGFRGGVPVRGFRYQAVRQIWYFDPQRKTRLAVTVPQDQFVLVPVHTF